MGTVWGARGAGAYAQNTIGRTPSGGIAMRAWGLQQEDGRIPQTFPILFSPVAI
jgi:hypothetical protein